MNITGIWTYEEDFEFGKSTGEVEIVQSKHEVVGIFTFTERVENDYEICVIEKAKGTILDGKVLLESTDVKAMQNGKEIDYLSNNFEIYLISNTKLVGSTFDSDNVCGVFVLNKKDDENIIV